MLNQSSNTNTGVSVPETFSIERIKELRRVPELYDTMETLLATFYEAQTARFRFEYALSKYRGVLVDYLDTEKKCSVPLSVLLDAGAVFGGELSLMVGLTKELSELLEDRSAQLRPLVDLCASASVLKENKSKPHY